MELNSLEDAYVKIAEDEIEAKEVELKEEMKLAHSDEDHDF